MACTMLIPAQILKLAKYDTLEYIQVLQQGLRVMDATATSLCMDNGIPIIVFNFDEPGNILRAVMGEKIGTVVGMVPKNSAR